MIICIIYCKFGVIKGVQLDKIFFLKALENRRSPNGGSACIQITKTAVIDAGNLLSLNQNELLEYIFITHSHLDHVLDLPFYIDTNFTKFQKPLKICAGINTIKTLKKHIFNGEIWPDFYNINLINSNHKAIEFIQIEENRDIFIDDIAVTPIKSLHTVECYGFIIRRHEHSIYFTSDTHSSTKLWDVINTRKDIRQVVLDIAFPSRLGQLAFSSLHMTPKIVEDGMKHLKRDDVVIHAFHLKSGFQDEIIGELKKRNILGKYGRVLKDGTSVYFNPSYLAKTNLFLTEKEILTIIFNTTSKISQEINFENILNTLATMVQTMLVSERCTLWIADYENKIVWTKVAQGLDEIIKIPINSGIVGKTIQEKKSLVINDPYHHPDFNKSVDMTTGYKTRSIITMPIFDSQKVRVIGVYQALNKQSNVDYSFNESDLKYLQLAATFTGQIYESMLLNKELESTQREIIYTLASVCESRSNETGNHVKRVAKYSRILAKLLGMSEKQSNIIELGSTTHDIGKIAIPDAVLNKPGIFDKEDRRIMNKHSAIGYDMLKHSKRPILKTAATIAYEHHEKYNGKGYPRGLKGEEINISARIVALADVFDALGSDRVYKKAWKLEDIYALLKKERGEHFDPNLIDLFFGNLDQFLEVKDRYQDRF